MKIPQLYIGHTNIADGKDLIVKNSVYKNEHHLESSFPHKHSFYMICLIRSGSGIHVVDFEEIPVIKNRLFILNPSQVHFWKLDTDTNISLVQFAGRNSTSKIQVFGIASVVLSAYIKIDI